MMGNFLYKPVSRIFLCETLNSLGEVVCFLLIFGLNGHRNDWIWHKNCLHAQVLRFVEHKSIA